MAKRNLTIQYFDGTAGRDGTHDVLGPADTPANRSPIMRLCWNHEELPIDWDDLAQMIEHSSLPDAVFFLDSSFFDRHEIPWKVWAALLTRQIAFTPLVWSELDDWRSEPFANEQIRDSLGELIDSNDPRVQVLDTTTWPTTVRENARRYIELIGCRKLAGIAVAQRLREERGGEKPSHGEVTRELQKIVRKRGLTLARKGASDVAKPNFLADEQLIVCAIFNAILTGREAAVLTRDVDLVEQFYKAIYLVDTDYRSLLISDAFANAPDNIVVHDVGTDELDDVFEPTEKKILALPRRFQNWVLPNQNTWVNVNCLRLGGHRPHMKLSRLSFCAEQEMSDQLKRGVTDSEGKRTHICVSPPFAASLAGHAIVGTERHVTFGPWKPSAIDLDYALHEVEHFRRVRIDPSMTIATDSLGLDLATFRLEERLMFSKQPEWFDFGDEEIATSIRYAEPSAILFCDQTFLGSEIAECVGKALVERRFATTEKVRNLFQGRPVSSPQVREAFERRERAIDLYAPSETDYQHGFGYYLALLAFRKQYGGIIRRRVLREYGRESHSDEWPQIVEHYSGRRGRYVAEEGERRNADESLFNSDELLVQGLLTSVYAGADVVFLTCDPIFMDQFVKLCRFVKEHYLAFRLECCMADSPESFPTYELKSNEEENHIIHDLAPDWMANVLPPDPYYVNLHCWLIHPLDQSRLCAFTFCAERPMHRLLWVKGSTGGRNVDRTDGRNLRLGQAESGEFAALLSEEEVQFGSVDLPLDERLDLRVHSLPKMDLIHWANQQEDVTPVWFD